MYTFDDMKANAEKVRDALEKGGVEAFTDYEGVKPGDSIPVFITLGGDEFVLELNTL